MNLTFHLVRHDMARMRPWIAIWMVSLIAPIVVGAWMLRRSPFDGSVWTAPDVLAIITGTQVFIGYLLTVILIHEHPLIGTTQFWLTRPISRGRLFAAKAIGAFLIVALPPLLVGLPWWLWCGFGAADIANVGMQSLVVMVIIVICGATVAALTDTLARALLWTVAFVAMAMFAMMFFAMTSSTDAGEVPLAITRSVVAIVAIAMELIAVIILQFFVRRRRGWWLGAAAALIVGTLLGSVRLRSSWFELSEPPEINPARVAGMAIEINGAKAMPPAGSTGGDRPYSQVVSIGGVITGVDRGMTVSGVAARQHWRFSDGLEISRDSVLDVLDSPFETRRHDWISFRARPALPRSVVAKMTREPAAYDARYWFRIGRFERWFEAPLGATGWLAFGAHRARVEDTTVRGEDIGLEVVTTSPFWLRESLISTSRFRPWFGALQQPHYVVIDHDSGRLSGLGGQRRHAIVCGVAVDWHKLTLYRRDRRGRALWNALPEALKSKDRGYTFAAIGWRTEAQVGRSVKVDELVVAK